MLETPHVVVGAAIATHVLTPALAIPLAVGSHFILDKVPHWNPHLFTETQKLGRPAKKSTTIALIDVGIALATGLFLASRFASDPPKMALILTCSLAGVTPDLVKWPYYYLGQRSRLLTRWVLFERSLQVNADFWPGIITQLAVIVAGAWWFFS
ncbi:MAG: hypothetical protein ACOYT7_02310 [Patescibacteria group bacterium]